MPTVEVFASPSLVNTDGEFSDKSTLTVVAPQTKHHDIPE
jgi:hypothetical protein